MKDYRPETQAFYKTKAWRTCRDAYLSSVGGLCERCKANGEIVPAYLVHHKIYLDSTTVKDPSISLNFDNLEALCFTCHQQEHFADKTPRRWKYVNGNLQVAED